MRLEPLSISSPTGRPARRHGFLGPQSASNVFIILLCCFKTVASQQAPSNCRPVSSARELIKAVLALGPEPGTTTVCTDRCDCL